MTTVLTARSPQSHSSCCPVGSVWYPDAAHCLAGSWANSEAYIADQVLSISPLKLKAGLVTGPSPARSQINRRINLSLQVNRSITFPSWLFWCMDLCSLSGLQLPRDPIQSRPSGQTDPQYVDGAWLFPKILAHESPI